MPFSTMVRALALASHPIPSVAVTALAAGLCALAGLSPGRGTLVTAAVFTGQLSIGWSNDYLDAARDRAVNRRDKPVATGEVAPRAVGIATLVALLLTILLSLALGWPGGAAALVVVACGWLYNLGLKTTVLSWLPYAVAFGMLPAVATLSASPPRWPQVWALAAGALLGVAAHLANVLPDLEEDAATGVRGLPHRLGMKTTALAGAAILLVASAVILFGPVWTARPNPTGGLNATAALDATAGPGGQPGPWRWAGLVAAVLVAGTAAASAFRDPSSRRFFRATILIAAMDLIFFALSGTSL
jgi:4-hydroxybenzoate polyprenyltransferase